MIASPQLISALRRAANRIAAPDSEYDHGNFSKCNCGILAQELLDDVQYNDFCAMPGGDWTDSARRCSSTGLPISSIIRRLSDAGLPPCEIGEIEHCDRREVLERIGQPIKEDHADDVALYFRTYADLLEEQLTPPRPLAPALTLAAQAWPVVVLPQAEKVGVV